MGKEPGVSNDGVKQAESAKTSYVAMKKYSRILIVLFVFLCVGMTLPTAQAYEWKSEDGTLTLSNKRKKTKLPKPGERQNDTPTINKDPKGPGRSAGKKSSKKLVFWKVESTLNTVYLLGSIHYLPKSFYPLDDRILAGYHDSDYVAVEVNKPVTVRPTKSQPATHYTGRDVLDNHISQRTRDLMIKNGLKKYLESKLRPMTLVRKIEWVAVEKIGMKAKYGIDRYFVTLAQRDNKQVLGLEDANWRYRLLEGISDKHEDRYLYAALKSINKVADRFRGLLEGWKRGDLKAIEKFGEGMWKGDPDAKNFNNKMLHIRNDKMTERCETFLKRKRNYFVIAGCAHMVGRTGIPHQLRTRGYKVYQYGVSADRGGWRPYLADNQTATPSMQ